MDESVFHKVPLTDAKTIAHRRNAIRHAHKMVEQLIKSCPTETTGYSNVILNAIMLTVSSVTDVVGPVSHEEMEMALMALPEALESIKFEERLN